MNVAFYGAVVVAIPIALAVIFFQRNSRIIATLEKPVIGPLDPDTRPADEIENRSFFLPWPKAISLFLATAAVISIIVRIAYQSVPEDPKVTFGELPDVQQKILRTMWQHQKSVQTTSGGGFLYAMPIHPGTAEYIEFHPHLDSLSKRNYIQCNCFDEQSAERAGTKSGCYCYFIADGINLMLSIGELSTGAAYPM